ncbi:MAG: hypothetical protein BGO51_23250 [Rhodospirillales bacterium 69-11]|nr:hypothetical protein [Rhodospirillales bacterium]MBN8927048.1 hypothetical protein [Rhodospirillales bacterium]OJW31411.1 MAG: hypothetical protein BGO51_23250 [Rhodospirillales bacterium 69-11]
MTAYRVFPLDRAGHVSAPPIVLTCHSDHSALSVAPYRLGRGQTAEIWIGERLVGRVEGVLDVATAECEETR